ncbi:PREDICTED: protein NPC2 homolog isoform X2 [Vollenhovia emeryi]|uniref:protein NPC2 homolog isoform X2 n=1 Tax=Vollenhovia emeryi TaxID=411798 RepID=UPI0005F3AB66|nr:PREDICTED: protein NPC2 homolog isoform X2 [Vollenhovia emeryi]
MTRVTIVALFYALCYFASSLAVTFQDCGSKSGKFTEILVSGCEMTQENCILKRGTNASISIKFIPNKDISQVKVRVYGVLVHVPVPFPFQKSDACNDPDDGITCPLKKNQEYHYTTTLFVEKKYPKDLEKENYV